MATGYTYKIKDGNPTFREFALDCARAFGACVELRDEPGGGEKIPDAFHPDLYYKQRGDDARSKLATLEAMTESEADAKAHAQFLDALAYNERADMDRKGLRAKYEAMLAKVRNWEPPTEQHRGLKDFMADQIVKSIEWDCSGGGLGTPMKLSGAQWLAENIAECKRDIERCDGEYQKELQRTAERNKWIADLRASLVTNG